jgi:hypothetical protein
MKGFLRPHPILTSQKIKGSKDQRPQARVRRYLPEYHGRSTSGMPIFTHSRMAFLREIKVLAEREEGSSECVSHLVLNFRKSHPLKFECSEWCTVRAPCPTHSRIVSAGVSADAVDGILVLSPLSGALVLRHPA